MEDLRSSRKAIFWLKCDHPIHVECFQQLQKTTVKCPICSKSFYNKEELLNMNSIIDSEIINSPMPDEYADKEVQILCNDCCEESTVKFHIFGHKCLVEKEGNICGSYNTRRV